MLKRLTRNIGTLLISCALSLFVLMPAQAETFFKNFTGTTGSTTAGTLANLRCSSIGAKDGIGHVYVPGTSEVQYWLYDNTATDAEDSTHIRCKDSSFTSGVWEYLTTVGDLTGTINPGADPAVTFMDSDNPGTDKSIAQIAADYISGADGAENGDLYLRTMIAGTMTDILTYDVANGQWETTKPFSFAEIIEEQDASSGGTTPSLDCSSATVFTHTVATGATTFTFSNPAASGKATSLTLILTNGGSQTVTWPTSVDWAGGTAPTLTAAGIDILTFVTIDGGTIWYGFLAGSDMQ